MLLLPILFTMLFMAGAKVKHLVLIICMGLAVSPVLWFKMREYQRLRISSVLLQNDWLRTQAEEQRSLGKILAGENFNSDQWMRDVGYQLNRSKIAIASGGLTGHGFREGDLIKYGFILPELHNDFIFATIANQWGFLGCMAVLGLYVVIFLCGLEITLHNTDPFGRLLCIGVLAMIAFEVFVNVGMTVGLMPITGLTLPLVSYGGSSLLVSMMAIGLLNNVGRSRPFMIAKKM
jgi:rod shape determining protein RodA